MGSFQTKTEKIEAYQISNNNFEYLEILSHGFNGEKPSMGDWVVQWGEDWFIYTDKSFKENFEPILELIEE